MNTTTIPQVRILPEKHRAVKVYCAIHGGTIQEFVNQAIDEALARSIQKEDAIAG